MDELFQQHNPYGMLNISMEPQVPRKNPRLQQRNPFKDLTAQQKNQLSDQAEILGLDAISLMNGLQKHGGMRELARGLGRTDEEIEALQSYRAPNKIESNMLRAEAFGDTLNKYFNHYIEKAEPYKKSTTYMGYTPKVMIDQALGKNKQAQIDFLTAQGLARDTAVQQVLMSNMRAGHYSVEAIEKALQHVTPGFQFVDADVRKGVMNNIHKVFKEGVKESNKATSPKALFARHLRETMGYGEEMGGIGYGDSTGNMGNTQLDNSGMDSLGGTGSIRFQAPNGQTYTIPEDRQDAIQEAQRRGWRPI